MSNRFRSHRILAFAGGLVLISLLSRVAANPQQITATQPFTYPLLKTSSACASSASPAVCSAAPAGFVAVPASATTLTVDTTAVTANSQIFLQFDSSLGTALSVTCNASQAGKLYWVSARSAGTSFTITTNTSFATNFACLSYFIVN